MVGLPRGELWRRLAVLAVSAGLAGGCGHGGTLERNDEDEAEVVSSPGAASPACPRPSGAADEAVAIRDHVSYFIRAKASGRLVEVEGAGEGDGAQVVLADHSGRTQQQFELPRAEGGQHYLRAKHSRRTLNMTGGSSGEGARVQQWEGTWDENRFAIAPSACGGVTIVNKRSRRCLTAVTDDPAFPAGAVVQRACADSGAVRDAQLFTLHPSKKGYDLVTGRDGWVQRLTSLKPGWYYSWGGGIDPNTPPGIEFIPMVWGYWGAGTGFLETIERHRTNGAAGRYSELLGFNEPDGAQQANLSVDRALTAWPHLESTGLRLGSPAGIHANAPWMREFMTRATAENKRVDFVTVHWYGGASARSFIDHLHAIYALHGKPIWITEFAPADWGAATPAENRFSDAQVQQFMREVLPQLDALPFVERYAWFSFNRSGGVGTSSALFEADGRLTPLGEIYSRHPF